MTYQERKLVASSLMHRTCCIPTDHTDNTLRLTDDRRLGPGYKIVSSVGEVVALYPETACDLLELITNSGVHVYSYPEKELNNV